LTKLTIFWENIEQYSPNLLWVYLQTKLILAYLSKNTGFWSSGVPLKSSHFYMYIFIIGSNLKLWMLQHFWVNNSLKIKYISLELYCIHFTAVLTSNYPLFFRGKALRVFIVKKTQYRLIPVLIFLKYRYYTGPGIEKSIPNWKH
jgi:hypothetical protein